MERQAALLAEVKTLAFQVPELALPLAAVDTQLSVCRAGQTELVHTSVALDFQTGLAVAVAAVMERRQASQLQMPGLETAPMQVAERDLATISAKRTARLTRAAVEKLLQMTAAAQAAQAPAAVALAARGT